MAELFVHWVDYFLIQLFNGGEGAILEQFSSLLAEEEVSSMIEDIFAQIKAVEKHALLES